MKFNKQILKALFEAKLNKTFKGVVYHGSNSDFKKFVYSDRNKGKVREVYGPGFYFTNNPDYAKNYGRNIIKAEISLKKPLYCEGKNLPELSKKEIEQMVIAWYDFVCDDNNLKLFKNSFFSKLSKGFWKGGGTKEDLQIICKECYNFSFLYDTLFKDNYSYNFIVDLNHLFGYDGIICKLTKETTIYVCWFEEQIKKI